MDKISVQFLDLSAYGVPGCVLAVLVWPWLRRTVQASPADQAKVVEGGLFLVATLILGVMVHISATAAQGTIERFADRRVLAIALDRITVVDLAGELMSRVDRLDASDPLLMYRYVEAILPTVAPSRADTSSRLTALSICCRNLAVAVVIGTVGLAASGGIRRRHAVGAAGGTMVLVGLLMLGAWKYYASAVSVNMVSYVAHRSAATPDARSP